MALIDQHSVIMGLFGGLMLAMVLVNLFCFTTTRKPVFAIFSAYVIFLTLSLLCLTVPDHQQLWQQSPWFEQHVLAVFITLSAALSMILGDLLLDVKACSEKLSRLLKAISVFYLVSAAASLFISLPVFVSVFLLSLVLSWALICAIGIWMWFKGQTIAGMYTLARSLLFIGVLLICVDDLNLLKFNIVSDYLLALAAAIEVLLLALILNIKHNRQQTDAFAAQNQLLAKTLREKNDQDEILTMQETTKEDLEYKVQERTLELEIALRELSDTNRELQEKNTLDALTGVRNRSYFDKKYIAEIRRSRRERTHLSIVMLDIDHFKSINDKYGHLIGDDCIKAVATTIKNTLKRPSDDLCRYGGEEFVLILPSTELTGATALVEQIRQTIEQTPIHSDGFIINLSISAGIASAIASANKADEAILAAADQQLYHAKNAGRNNVKATLLADNDELTQD